MRSKYLEIARFLHFTSVENFKSNRLFAFFSQFSLSSILAFCLCSSYFYRFKLFDACSKFQITIKRLCHTHTNGMHSPVPYKNNLVKCFAEKTFWTCSFWIVRRLFLVLLLHEFFGLPNQLNIGVTWSLQTLSSTYTSRLTDDKSLTPTGTVHSTHYTIAMPC